MCNNWYSNQFRLKVDGIPVSGKSKSVEEIRSVCRVCVCVAGQTHDGGRAKVYVGRTLLGHIQPCSVLTIQAIVGVPALQLHAKIVFKSKYINVSSFFFSVN